MSVSSKGCEVHDVRAPSIETARIPIRMSAREIFPETVGERAGDTVSRMICPDRNSPG